MLTSAAQAQGRVGTTSVIEITSTLVLIVGVLIGMHLGGLVGAGAGSPGAGGVGMGWVIATLSVDRTGHRARSKDVPEVGQQSDDLLA